MKRRSDKKLISRMVHKITIQRETGDSISDGAGGFTSAFVNFGDSVWASVDPIQAKQRKDYLTIGEDVTHLIQVSGYTDILSTDRIAFDSRKFEILSIENIRERDFRKFVVCNEVKL